MLRTAEQVLAPDGSFVFEVPYLLELVQRTAFDTIYHEHVHYYGVKPLAACLARHGFGITRIDSLEYMCGSIRVYARRGVGMAPVDGLLGCAVAFERAADAPARAGRSEPAVVRLNNPDQRDLGRGLPARAPAKPRLLLSPFAMHGVESSRAHLVHGFSLHLAASLVRFREWSVIDRPAVAVVPLAPLEDAPQYRLETTAYQAGSEINMVMVLRDETTGIFVWSESLRLGLDNWFETQQRIIRRIATSLNVQLSAERLRRLAGEPDVSLDVYDRWLRGQSLIAKFDPESWRRAVAIFRDTIREHPGFSPCYSSLVQINNIAHTDQGHMQRFRYVVIQVSGGEPFV